MIMIRSIKLSIEDHRMRNSCSLTYLPLVIVIYNYFCSVVSLTGNACMKIPKKDGNFCYGKHHLHESLDYILQTSMLSLKTISSLDPFPIYIAPKAYNLAP